MKYSLLALLLFSTHALAHDFPNQKAICTFGDNKNVPCTVETGGGAGGSYYTLKSKTKSIYVESSDCQSGSCSVSIGNNPDNTYDGKEFKKDGFYCASSINGKIKGCFKNL